MTTLLELHATTGISLKHLRKLERLKIDFGDIEPPEPEPYADIKFYLARNPHMTVAQCLRMLEIEGRADFDRLGAYRKRVVAQMDALGDVAAEHAPADVTAYIIDASRNDPDAVEILAQWIRQVLPTHNVNFQWIACRLLWRLKGSLRDDAAKALIFAMMNVRNAARDIWHKNARDEIFYRKPLDL